MGKVYRIKDWNVHFENNKSRVIDRCSSVFQPNKQHGLGFKRIMGQPDGMAIYGMWSCIVQMCSQQQKPREGWLTEDGKPSGPALSAEDIAFKLGRPIPEVERCLEFVSSQRIGWLEIIEVSDACPPAAAQLPLKCPPAAAHDDTTSAARCKEGRNEGTKEGSTHSLSQQPAPEVPSLEEVLTVCRGPAGIPENYGREFWDAKQMKPQERWFQKTGQLVNWKHQLVTWWAKDRVNWESRRSDSIKNGGGNSRAERRGREQGEQVSAPSR